MTSETQLLWAFTAVVVLFWAMAVGVAVLGRRDGHTPWGWALLTLVLGPVGLGLWLWMAPRAFAEEPPPGDEWIDTPTRRVW